MSGHKRVAEKLPIYLGAFISKEKEEHVSEDEVKKEHDEIQKITDSFIKRIDELAEHKEREIMEV